MTSPASVTVVGGGLTGADPRDYGGVTFYQWSFQVVVNGVGGTFVTWLDVGDPGDTATVVQDVTDTLEADPTDYGFTPGPDGDDRGDYPGGDGPDGADDGGDEGDGALAGGGDPGFGDSA